jgi:Ca2+-binding EF-hand superfamily protein
MREVFDKWDLNHDGKIVKGELQEIMIKAGLPLTEEELTVIFNRLDVDKDGTINFEEFMAIAPNNRLRSSIKGAFERLDNDGDGYITKSEMRKAFQRVGQFISEKELNEIYKSFDIDSDGKINLEGLIIYYFVNIIN